MFLLLVLYESEEGHFIHLKKFEQNIFLVDFFKTELVNLCKLVVFLRNKLKFQNALRGKLLLICPTGRGKISVVYLLIQS